MREQFSSFGYPKIDSNVRQKAHTMFDTLTFSTGTLEYNLFVNPSLSPLTRNRVLPISNNEVFFINEISAFLSGQLDLGTNSDQAEIFSRSFLQITVDDRLRLKIPLVEILNIPFVPIITSGMPTGIIDRKRRLQFPIIINSSSNVNIKVVCSTQTATRYNNSNLVIELSGIKMDKLNQFMYDPRKDSGIERLSFTIYDTNAFVVNSAQSYDLFSISNKAISDFSKTFPLGDKEVFTVENIEIFFGYSTGAINTTLASELYSLRRLNLKILLDDVEYFNSRNGDLLTLIAGTTPGPSVGYGYFTRKGLTLPVPIDIPATSKVKITLDAPAIPMSALAGTAYFCTMLKGTLQRIVA